MYNGVKSWQTGRAQAPQQMQATVAPATLATWTHGFGKSELETTQSFARNMIQRILEGSLEVKLPTIWTDEKQRWEESEKRKEKKRSEKKKSQKKEDAGARKGRKVAKRCVFSNVLWLRRVEK